LNLLRFLGNELRIPLVGVGTHEAYLAIRADDQLENRFAPLPLPRWEPATADACSLLASFAAGVSAAPAVADRHCRDDVVPADPVRRNYR
jgi:Bacterial TniB protein